MTADLLSLSFGERFILTPMRTADNFLRVSTDNFLPVSASLIFLLCSSDLGGSFLHFGRLTSAEFWLVVIIFTLLTAYGPRSLWRAIWYWWDFAPRSSKWPEVSQIFSHSSNVNSNAIPRRLAQAFCTKYLLRGVAIRGFGIANTCMFSVASGRVAVRRCTAALYPTTKSCRGNILCLS